MDGGWNKSLLMSEEGSDGWRVLKSLGLRCGVRAVGF